MLAVMAAPLIFNGAVFADDHPLKGTRWVLKKVQGVAAHPGLPLSFEDTRVTGSTGCTRFWAPVDSPPAPAIDIGPPQSARLYCQGAMAVERAYLASLETVVTFRIDGSILQMSLDDGDIFLELERDQTSSP